MVRNATHVTTMTTGVTGQREHDAVVQPAEAFIEPAGAADCETSVSRPSISPIPKMTIAVNTPLPMPVAAMAAGPSRRPSACPQAHAHPPEFREDDGAGETKEGTEFGQVRSVKVEVRGKSEVVVYFEVTSNFNLRPSNVRR
jgi:hypothetical protein